jgi:LPS sulfotransferase NodH
LRGYVISATPRSGSNLLCDALTSTGTLGRPAEYLNVDALRLRGLSEFKNDVKARLGQAIRLGTTANGVFGLKLFVPHFADFAAAAGEAMLGDLVFVHLTRNDLLGQAISYVRAAQTQAWRSNLAARGEARFDEDAIAAAILRFATDDARWRAYFARNGIKPISLHYEALVEDPEPCVATVAAALGLEKPVLADLSFSELRVQRDQLSMAWRRRFCDSRRDFKWLDELEAT